MAGRSPLLRLQSDDRLIALIRGGNEAAFEQLFDRYRARLMAFCRHMLASKEDAEDVMQGVFVNAYNAMRADEREINARPWLYRIARNRCLNHLRKQVPDGQDTMDEFVGAGGVSTADIVHKRADLRNLLTDVQKLPETQRTALLMREVDVLSYGQIAEAMETTVPSVKSLLVRARMSLAEATEARAMSCDDVRMQLAEVTEGLRKLTPALKRHVRDCEDCRAYKKMLKKTNTAMAMALSVGPLMVLKKLLAAKLGIAAASHAGGGAAATGTVAAGGAAATVGGGAASAGAGALVTKAAVGLALTALVAGGAVEAEKTVNKQRRQEAPPARVAPLPAAATGGVSAAEAKQAETANEQAAEEDSATTAEGTDTTATDDTTTTTDGSAGSEGSGDSQDGSQESGDEIVGGGGSAGGGSGGSGGVSTPATEPDIVPGGGSPPSGGGAPTVDP